MGPLKSKFSLVALAGFLLSIVSIAAFAQETAEISSSPASLSFGNVYLGKISGSKVLTISNLTTSGTITIETVSFSCAGFGLSSGTAPFQMGTVQKITHYSIFFQPTTAQAYSCNFILTLNDGSFLNVPLTGTGKTSAGTSSLSKTSFSFPNQNVGTTSPAQTVTITNSGTSSITLSAINLSPPSFTAVPVTLPATISAGGTLPISVSYTPSQITSETGALDLTYNEVPDNGVTLTGNGTTPASLEISTFPTLPQATQNAAYQYNLAASGGTSPYTWSLASGSTLPSGLSLSSAGVVSGTLSSSVATGSYTFTVKVTDTASRTSTTLMTLGVYANLGDSCNNLSFDVPGTSTPMVALNDLGTGTYQGSEGGLYPNGSNVRPSGHDSDGRAFAQAIQPLDSNGNPSSTGKYVLLAVGESTEQNEFNRFLPIANADPAKNPALVLVNGSQGGATPNNFTSPTSAYWLMVLNNYLPQNGVTANQVVAIELEDTDGIATGTFPTDISALQSEYETMMQTMHTLFPNLKLVYFSSRVYAGYSNGVATINPEPYAYETGFAVKWAIQDQLDGNANLNYNVNNGPVVAPWMAWGPYYWANGMLGRSDGLEWDCEDFSSDGTHPSLSFGQLKVATALLGFLKTDNTTAPWYLAPNLNLAPTAGNNQSGNTGTTLSAALTVLASNLNSGNPISGVSVTFTDGGAGGSFGTPTAVTGSDGMASSTYTLPATAQTVAISATSQKYSSATFTETATAKTLSATAGNNQTGNAGSTLPIALTVFASSGGNAVQGLSVTFSDGGAGGTFGTPTGSTGSDGTVATTYTLPSTAKTVSITASASGYTPANFTETSTATQIVATITLVSGGKQVGTVGTALPAPVVMKAKNSSGQVVVGASLSFSDGGLGGTFSPNPAVTGSTGQASTTYTLPTSAKTITVTASNGSVSGKASEQSVAGAASALSILSGNNQSGSRSHALAKKLVVFVADRYGNGVAGIAVTFTDNGARGSFSPANPVTGATGQASVTYTAGSTAGTVTVSASAAGLTTVNFTETIK